MNDLLLLFFGILPIAWLFFSLCVLRLPGHVACPCGLALAAALALIFLKTPADQVFTAALEGVIFAVWPILLVIIAAIILYRYSEETGGMDKIKELLTGVSRDKRILVLILAWGFGGFLEGIAGFGVPVLIPGLILVALGFSPMLAVVACLVANSASTPFATIGIPVTTLSGVTGLDPAALGFNVAIQLFIPCIILPFFLVMLTGGGVRAVRGIGLITLIAGLAFALPLLLVSRFIGPELPTLLGSVCVVVCVTLSSKKLYRDTPENKKYQLNIATTSPDLSSSKVTPFQACLPFGTVLVLVTATSLIGPLHEALSALSGEVVVYSGPEGHTLTFAYLLTPGVLILISTALACLLQGRRLAVLGGIARGAVLGSRNMAVTIVTIVAMAKVMDYCGMTDAIAVWLVAVFAAFYPLVAPVIGMLGTFITGSDTTCCILFGGLQVSAAGAIGADPAWIASSNLSAAAAGKMISPQSVAVGLRIGGLEGKEGEIIRRTLVYALICTGIVSLITFGAQNTVLL